MLKDQIDKLIESRRTDATRSESILTSLDTYVAHLRTENRALTNALAGIDKRLAAAETASKLQGTAIFDMVQNLMKRIVALEERPTGSCGGPNA